MRGTRIAGVAVLGTVAALALSASPSFAASDCARAQSAVADAQKAVDKAKHRVKKAKGAVKRADAGSAKQRAKRKLRKAKKRLKAAKADLATATGEQATACGGGGTAPSGQGLYVALGDSVGAGYGASNPSTTGYVGLLYAHFQSTLGVTQLSNRSTPGQASADIRSSQLPGAVNDINASSDTKVVTIDAGGNDWFVAHCNFGSDTCTDTFKTNFNQILAGLQSALANDPGDEDLIAMDYYNPNSGGGTYGGGESTLDTVLRGQSQLLNCADTGSEIGLNDAIEQVASAHGALIADPYQAFKDAGRSYIYSDGIHPTDAGHAAIAAAFEGPRSPCT